MQENQIRVSQMDLRCPFKEVIIWQPKNIFFLNIQLSLTLNM
jgi:hypothetical protein